MATQMSPVDRMQAAYERAMREGIRLYQRPDGSVYAVGSDGQTRYDVTAHTCTCPAGAHDRICKHRALYITRKAIREALATTPPTPLDPEAVARRRQAEVAKARMAAADPAADAAMVARQREARLARMAAARDARLMAASGAA